MISVIIPAYNAEKTLPDCLEALKNQSLIPQEIIVVDDGSTDRTAQVAKGFNVIVISQPNQGPAAARNAGIAQSCGDILLFTDSDCIPDAFWVERMVVAFTNPVVDGVKGVYRTHQSEVAARLVQMEFEDRYRLLSRSGWIDFVDGHAAAFRREAVLQIGGFDPAFPEANNEDVDFSYRLAAAGKRMVFRPDAIVYHRHPDSFWKYFKVKIKRGYWRMIVYKQHPGKAIRDSYTPQVMKFQILFIYAAAAALFLSLITPHALWGVGLSLIFFILSIAPFFRFVERSDPRLAILGPWFILVRAVAFSLGILGGLAGMLAFRFKLSPGKPS
ncbi:MAG TPA: glycosyltransferase [Anaerolineaceae bacterium]|nr:glycosyltransferase [Anaerolineaceae bacterium]